MGDTTQRSSLQYGNGSFFPCKEAHFYPCSLLAKISLRISWARDPQGQREPKAYFSTDQGQSAGEMVEDFVKRWSLEVTYEESRAHLGVETQRQWSDLAIERSTPCLLGLYSLVVLLGHALHPDGQVPVQQAAWYPKTQATFADVLATVRRHLC